MFTQDLLAQAKSVITQFNSQVPENHRYPVDDLEDRLYGFGASTDQDLRGMKWEEWESVGLPRRLAQSVAAIYRGAEEHASSSSQTMTLRTVSDEVSELSNRDLVARFAQNPTVLHGAVAEQLRARSGDRPCIGYHADGSIDVETTTMVLEGLATGDEFGDFTKARGRRVNLYKVGHRQGEVRNEHPVFAGRSLRADGLDHFNVDWSAVPLECGQLIRLAVETGGINPETIGRKGLIRLRDIALQEGALASLQERFSKAARLFEDRRELDSLPVLKARSGSGVLVSATK